MNPSSPQWIWTTVAGIAMDLREGNRSALTRLFDLAGPRLLRYAEMLTKNRADAEDAFQSAMVRVARKPQQFAEAENPWAYLVQIVRNEAIKTINRKRVSSSLQQMLNAWRAPECLVEQSESRELIQEAIRKLPTEQAEVVVLKIWEGFTFAEIATLINESPNTAASRYRYALEKLSRFLQPLAEEVRHV